MYGMYWLSTLVYLNILWISGVLLGGIIFGLAPATTSLAHVLKKIIWHRQQDIKIGLSFYSEYRQIWKETNKFIFLFYFIYLFLWVDFRLITQFYPFLFPVVLFLFLLVFLITVYFIIFYQVFPYSFWYRFKNSILLPWLFPLHSLGILILTVALLFLSIRFSFLIVIGGVSFPLASFYYLLRKKYWQNFKN